MNNWKPQVNPHLIANLELKRESVLTSKYAKSGESFTATQIANHLSDQRNGYQMACQTARDLLDKMVKDGLLITISLNKKRRFALPMTKINSRRWVSTDSRRWVSTDSCMPLGLHRGEW